METQNNNPIEPAAGTGRLATPAQRSWKSWAIAVLLTGAVGAFTLYVWMPDFFRAGSETQAPQTQKDEYYCPMHPQQKSDKPGNCPICSMKLVKLETAPEQAGQTATSGEEEYYCPMHPQQRSDEPGSCPICSMELVKVEKPAGPSETAMPSHAGMTMPAEPSTPGPAMISITPERQQLIGVKSVPATVRPMAKEIRTVGKVAFDETKITHIHTKVAGFIEEVFVDFVGKSVKRGDPLFTLYSPDLVATQEEYLLALRSKEMLKDSSFPWVSGGSTNLLEAARRRLLLWDITEKEITELERDGKAKRALTIYSPVSGVVTERAAYHHGRQVTPEMDLYTIVDLSTVWVLGETYESDLPHIRLGQSVRVRLPYAGGTKERAGKIIFISPMLNAATRTAETRVQFANPDLTLLPDMFVDFEVRVPLGSQVAVPEDAVLDTGAEQYVFVDQGQGYFEPRAVKLGPEAGGYYSIESGLTAGESVVTAANFLLDSESRLKGAFAGMGTPSPAHAAHQGAAPQNLNVEIKEPRRAKVGMNAIALVARDASGNPIEGAEVEVTLHMPRMGSMAPMTSKATLRHIGKGEYQGQVEIPMAWTWETTITASKDGRPLGTARTSITAR